MDVTRDSFEQSLEALDASIADPNFAFWSFDLEFTGLNVDRTSKFDVFDTLAERWKKVHTNVSKFTVLQYGICLFSFCPDTRRWQSKPFNFWLFPDSSRNSSEVFSCQASSLAFLSSCNFDFNKCVEQGVPFVSPSALRRQQQRADRDAQRLPIVPTQERDVEFVRDLKSNVEAWIKLADDDEEFDKLLLPAVNGFLRALTYQTLESDLFKPAFIAETFRSETEPPRIRLTRASPLEILRHKEKENAEKHKNYQLKVGFTAVLRKMLRSGKPAVGHNGLFDLAFTLEKFLCETSGDLSDARSAFAEHFTCPYYDTKLIANTFLDTYAIAIREATSPVAGTLAGTSNGTAGTGKQSGTPTSPPSISTKTPLDTALGPLFSTLTECALPAMMAKENKSKETAVVTPTRGRRKSVDVRGLVSPVAGTGEKVLDWLEFGDGFGRYNFALDRSDKYEDASFGIRKSYAHEAGYDAFMTGVCFLTMGLHGRSVVPADSDGGVRVFGVADGSAAAGPSNGAGPSTATAHVETPIGHLGACPFDSADGSLPLQHSDLGMLQLRCDANRPLTDSALERKSARGVVVLVGVTNGTSVTALAQTFAIAGLGVPLHVQWIGNGTIRARFPPERDQHDEYDLEHFAKEVTQKLLAVGTRVETLSIRSWKKREVRDQVSKQVKECFNEARKHGVDVDAILTETKANGRKRAFKFGDLLGGNGRNVSRRIERDAGDDAKGGCVVS